MTRLHAPFALLLASAACSRAPAVQPPPATPPSLATDRALEAALPHLTNWNRWDAEDERGTLNLIGPEEIRRAAALVRHGRTVSLAREVSLARTPGIREATYRLDKDELASRDHVGAVWHGFAQTHLDALCHAFASPDAMYNGHPTSAVGAAGCERLGIEVIAQTGVVGRGVLLDVAALKGSALEPGTAITVAELEAAAARQRLEIRRGDILAVRTGAGPANGRERRAGLHPDVLPWLREKGISLLVSDGDSDVAPFPGLDRWASPYHSVGIPYLGLPLVDNAELDVLAQTCGRLRRWEFLLTIAPWRIAGATSSPVNPIAVF